jgi:hypothetical protein
MIEKISFKQSQPSFQGSARSLVLQAATDFLTRRGDASKADGWQADAVKVQASQDYESAKGKLGFISCGAARQRAS